MDNFERLIEDMKQAQGITEQLKAENALEEAQRGKPICAFYNFAITEILLDWKEYLFLEYVIKSLR